MALLTSPFVMYFHGIKYQKQKQTNLSNVSNVKTKLF